MRARHRPEAALLEYLRCSTSWAAPARRSTDRRDRLRHDDRPRRARRPADRQGLRGGATAARATGSVVRRRGAGRAADRPHRPLPQRQRRGRRARQGRPDPQPGRLDHGDAASPQTARAPGDAAGGDAGPGDPRRHRRAAGGGLPVGARRSSTWSAARRCCRDRPAAAATGAADAAEVAAALRGVGLAAPRPRRVDRPLDGLPAQAAEQALERWRRVERDRARQRSTARPYELPPLPAASTSAALVQLADRAAPSRARHERGASAAGARRTRRRRAARRPGDRIIVCCGSGGVGKTTTAAALALRAAEQGRKVVRAHDRPGPAAGAVDGATELDNTPRPVKDVDRAGGDARRDDARHEADVRRGRRGARDAGEGAADPGQPVLPGAVELVRRHAGVHGDGEAGPAARRGRRGRRLGPDRRRHPADADPRWTSSTPPSGSASFLDGRLHQAAARAGQGPGRASSVRRLRRRHRAPSTRSSARRS